MKRLALTISLILAVVLALSFLYVSRVAAAKAPTPSVQMLSTSYGQPPVFLGGALQPVETLSFSVAAPAKLEVTSENTSLNFLAVCQIVLDGTVLVATPNGLFSSHPDLTVTDISIAAGSHTLIVLCAAAAPSQADGSLSTIITTGL